MTSEKEKSLKQIKRVAQGLGSFLNKVVFLGGSTVGLLITDSGAPDIRHTMDVDVIVGIDSTRKYHEMVEKLHHLGFTNKTGDQTCRLWIDEIAVDIMPINKRVLNFSNKWYPDAMKTARNFEIEPNLVIRLISPPCFLATKIEAHKDRGGNDYLTSHDLEDIINVINGREEIVKEVENTRPIIRDFISKHMKKFLNDDRFLEDINGFLNTDRESQERFFIIEERLKEISLFSK